MNFSLRIKLLSDLHTSGGSGQAGVVDRDIEYDDLGLPLLPARRLKGLWREAYRDLLEALSLAGLWKEPVEAEVDALFGRSGRDLGETSLFHLRDAEPFEKALLHPWLRWGSSSSSKTRLSKDEIQEALTSIRSQTALDRDTGSAKDDTLRRTRVLRQGLEFEAPLSWRLAPTEAQSLRLALAAAALQRMGLMRTRGLGRVRCSLHQDSADLTAQAFKLLEEQKHTAFVRTSAPPAPSSSLRALPSASQSPPPERYLLRYRLTLHSDLLLPALDGDANTALTQRSIPGRTLVGLFGWHFLRDLDRSRIDWDRFWRLFGRDVLFLPAYAEISSKDNFLKRSLPSPQTLRSFQDGTHDLLLDLSKISSLETFFRHDDKRAKPKLKRLRDRFGLRIGKEWTLATQTLGMSYHHFRTDRRLGRATQDHGGIFVAEALRAGQSFQAALIGDTKDLAFLRTIFPDPQSKKAYLGRSRSAQYGGEASLEWLDPTPLPLSRAGRQEDSWDPARLSALPSTPTRYLFRCLAPLLAVNQDGHPAPFFPKDEVAERLGIETIEIEAAWTRSEWIGGYWSHLKLPRPQYPAISAGSVFAIRLPEDVDPAKLAALETEGLGLWRHEGFGQIAILPADSPIEYYDADLYEILRKDGSKTSSEKPQGSPPNELHGLLATILLARTQREVSKQASLLAESAKKAKVAGSASLWGRMSLIVRQNLFSSQGLGEKIKALRPASLGILEGRPLSLPSSFRFGTLQGKRTLIEILKEAASQPDQVVRRWLQTVWSSGLQDFPDPAEKQQSAIEQALQSQRQAGYPLLREFFLKLFRDLQKEAKSLPGEKR